MRINSITIALKKTDLNLADFQNRSFAFAGKSIPVKQTITWAAVPGHNHITLEIRAQQLFLQGTDFRKEVITLDWQRRSIDLCNTDIAKMTLPDGFVCDCAAEWLAKIAGKTILKIKDYESGSGYLRSGMMHLIVGFDPDSKEPYGMLLLND